MKMFNDIIGYDDIKNNLKRIIDVLNNKEKYKELGSTIPHGLLLYGNPGVGKTSISQSFLSHCDRKSFIIRKTKSDGEFINYLNTIFKKAENSQPSIILLDDLDKFSENDARTNNEEYVTVQSLIDSVKDKDVFIIATANDKSVLPESLLRAGRFDIQIKIDNPNEKDFFEILKYYLSNKKISKDVNLKKISYIIQSSSCADLEKICNQAGIYAGYNNKKEIDMEDLLKASLEFAYKTSIEDFDKKDKYTMNVAYHEAGHALIGELLEPGSVLFATTLKTNSNTRGMTIFHNNDNYFDDIKFMKNRLKSLLAGKACIEVVYQRCDVGCNSDLHRVYNIARRFVDNYCMFGFDSWIENYEETSEKIKQTKDEKANELIANCYQEVKKLLIEKRSILDILAKKLYNKNILFKDEISEICGRYICGR